MTLIQRMLPAPVVTVLEPHERPRVDAAGAGFYHAIHRETVADALEELKHRRVSAVLLSVVRCGRESGRRMHAVVQEFPTVPAVALLGSEQATAESLLHLGNAGVTRLVDVRSPSGWTRLRHMLGSNAALDCDRAALVAIRAELGEVPEDCWSFFEALFTTSDRVGTVRELAHRMGVLPSTLMSRFFRARLPAPKRYLAFARLLRAARLFEDPGHSIADVANALEYSSPQSFGRHVRTLLGMTAGDFRRRHTGVLMLERLLRELVQPHRDALRTLRPLALRPGKRPDRPRPVHAAETTPPSVADRTPARARRSR